MTDLLVYLAGEGKGYVMFPSLFLFLFILYRCLKTIDSNANTPDKQKMLLSVYIMPDGKLSGLGNSFALYAVFVVGFANLLWIMDF